MRFTVLLRKCSDGKYEGVVPMFPGVSASGDTREQAIEAVEEAIRQQLRSGEFIEVNLPDVPSSGNEWTALAGIFADDPTLEPMLAEIYAARNAGQDAE